MNTSAISFYNDFSLVVKSSEDNYGD